MYIKKLTLHNFRCFADAEIDFQKNLTVLVGGNGSGKTSVLEGAVIAMSIFSGRLGRREAKQIKDSDVRRIAYKIGSNDDIQFQFPTEIMAEAVISPEMPAVSWKRCRNSSELRTETNDDEGIGRISSEYLNRAQNGDATLVLPIIAYYGTKRTWASTATSGAAKSTGRISGYAGCTNGTTVIALMMDWFERMTVQKYQRLEEGLSVQPELDVVCSAMETWYAIVTGAKNVKIRYNLDTGNLDIYYNDESGMRMRMPLKQMSDGYEVVLGLIADIAYRMAVLNPQLLGNVLTETDGIVFIDEIDLHLHPAWQQRVLGDLMSIFPKVQFVVTTHAPAVINSVRRDSLVMLENYQITYTGNQTYGKDVKSVMNEIMGVNDRPREVAELFDGFYSLLGEKEFDEAEKKLDQIDELRDYHDPEVVACRVKLKMERLRGGVV